MDTATDIPTELAENVADIFSSHHEAWMRCLTVACDWKMVYFVGEVGTRMDLLGPVEYEIYSAGLVDSCLVRADWLPGGELRTAVTGPHPVKVGDKVAIEGFAIVWDDSGRQSRSFWRR